MEDWTHWHRILQEMLDENMALLSGKKIRKLSREQTRYFRIDYYCEAEGDVRDDLSEKGIVRPFSHLREYNLIEYKSICQPLNEAVFREYVGRALLMENPIDGDSLRGRVTLTVLATRLPETLIATPEYAFERLNDWKYRSRWVKDLEIHILVQKGMRGKKEGEALALFQVLEGDRERQGEFWQQILAQNLKNVDTLKEMMRKIGKETFMNLIEELKREGRMEGRMEGAIEEALEMKFGDRGLGLMKDILEIGDMEILRSIRKLVRNAEDFEECASGIERLRKKM